MISASSTLLILAAFIAVPALNAQRQRQSPTDEQIMERVPEGVTFVPNIAYRKGNEAWKLDLAMPSERGNSPRPAIVIIHGGGWRNGDKRAGGFLNPTLEYAAKEYVCVTVNYRLSEEGDPKSIGHCIEDVKNAVRWLRAHATKYNIDPTRIGATGNSAGAHLSVMLGLCPQNAGLEGDGPYQDYSSNVQAVVASATPTSFLIPMSERGRERFAQEVKNPDPKRTAMREKISPISYVSADTPPILLFHEVSDKTVGVYQSDTFVKALREAGAKDVNYMLFGDGSGHGTFRQNIAITETAREVFFARTLMGKSE
jgi:acetyl esterase/lipase